MNRRSNKEHAVQCVRWMVLAATLASGNALAGYALSPPQETWVTSGLRSSAIGDVDGDGRNDVVLASPGGGTLAVLFQQADGTLAAAKKFAIPSAQFAGLALADLDRDGRKEIVYGHQDGVTILDWDVVKGATTRTMQSRYWGPADIYRVTIHDVAVLDIDRDGNLDVAGVSAENRVLLYFGDGTGRVKRTGRVHTPLLSYDDLHAADFNDDGFNDLAVLFNEDHALVYYNDGTDDFAPAVIALPLGNPQYGFAALGSGDFDDDGRQDLVAALRSSSKLAIFRQEPTFGFSVEPEIATGEYPVAVVGADLDLDGRDDLLTLRDGNLLEFRLQGDAGLGAATSVFPMWESSNARNAMAAGDINGDKCPDVVIANSSHSFVRMYGSGCNAIADLGVSVGMTASQVAVRLDNYGAGAAVAPEARVTLSTSTGTIAMGELPAGCTQQVASARSVRVTCACDTLEAGTRRTLLLPIALAGGDIRNTLSVIAGATTTSVEWNLANNGVSKSLRVGAVPPPTIAVRKVAPRGVR